MAQIEMLFDQSPDIAIGPFLINVNVAASYPHFLQKRS